MTIRLDIHAGGQTYAYPNALIVDEAIMSAERISDGRVDRAALRLAVVTASVLGASWLGDAPAGEGEDDSYRARVVIEETEQVLIDGVVRAAGLAHGRAYAEADGVRRWTIEVEQDAVDTLLSRFDALPASSLPGSATDASIGVQIGASQESLYAHRVLDLLEQAAAAVGSDAAPVTLDCPPSLFSLRIPYLRPGAPSGLFVSVPEIVIFDYDPARVGDATRVALPQQSARELLDLVQVLTGATLDAAYGPYPSRAIAARLVPPADAGTSGQPVDVDGIVEDYDMTLEEAEDPDLGVVYEGHLGASMGNDLVARYAAARWTLAVKEGTTTDPPEMVPGNASVLEIPAQLPSIAAPVSATRTHGEGIGAYTETVTMGFAVVEEKGLYLARRDETGFVVSHVEPASPLPSQPWPIVHELWAAVVLARQASRHAHLVASFSVPRSQLGTTRLRAGTWALGLHGLPWLLSDVEVNHDAGLVSIEMRRPHSAAVTMLVPPRRPPLLRVFYIDEVGEGDVVTRYAAAAASQIVGSQPGTIEIEYHLPEESEWTPFVDRIQTTLEVFFRARIVYGDGAGDYVTALLS